MKKLILIIGLLLIAGCGENFNSAAFWPAYNDWANNYAQQERDRIYMNNMQAQENAREINRQLRENAQNHRNSQNYYWQEKAARQQFYQNSWQPMSTPGITIEGMSRWTPANIQKQWGY